MFYSLVCVQQENISNVSQQLQQYVLLIIISVLGLPNQGTKEGLGGEPLGKNSYHEPHQLLRFFRKASVEFKPFSTNQKLFLQVYWKLKLVLQPYFSRISSVVKILEFKDRIFFSGELPKSINFDESELLYRNNFSKILTISF